jgi:HEAT repeat protein
VLSADPDLARAGVEAAAAVLDEETLLQACADRRDAVRRLALEALGEVPLRMAIPALIAALRLPDRDDRYAASISLHHLTGEGFDFDPEGAASERTEAIRRFERFWRERGPELYWDAAQRGFR